MHASAQQAPSATDPTPAPGAVSLAGVSKTFGDFTAVESLDLDVKPGEFLSMLGPSGSGKTTVLRMIAGFENVTSGSIHLSGTDVTAVPPHARQVNTVFQDYALFPHFTIAENVGYGLRVAGVSRAERATQVGVALEQVRLSAVADRLPHQLSGGQRQRIALARALILRPQVLLLDEPLGALDKQLREEMQIELKQIQREVGITFIFVTHDQEEALTLSDRVAVFNNGRVEQVGTAREVYEFPATEFVARFLGLSNLIPAELSADGVQSSVRPERVRLLTADTAASAGAVSLLGTVSETVYTGPTTRFLVDTESGVRVIAERANDHHPSAESAFARGDRVRVEWTTDHASRIG
ncbi:ABC transporter ATP-binding protein [Salinibacterium sp. NSLL150]|uniref:ABC transporter ATP-binding protein n=1 Tax=unclassified Salinibacterium TaxID=2632331 RepID=UPI0018CC8D6E|nr:MULTISPECIES: ABC transporter ATP-binding protein [unclassified Salinibacterium]MBH0097919.1 ABC transporter ATP-binding protein [Salinibacterium sp. NSLL35]MBH0100674.1 ABC transporter ATP-binding protein [Salinibacterium sp. NSLL150]MBH0103433.1 ABC transporter ATP-binding protein [Salinibacterium sp. NSLL16]MBH0106194.1 ABC transporter ATP-binding protein [Salinibacterium sp. NSLL17]